jgi:hypothetical protein
MVLFFVANNELVKNSSLRISFAKELGRRENNPGRREKPFSKDKQTLAENRD